MEDVQDVNADFRGMPPAGYAGDRGSGCRGQGWPGCASVGFSSFPVWGPGCVQGVAQASGQEAA